MNWQDTSEIVAGLILDKRLSLTTVRPELFYGEFRNLIKYMQEGMIEPEKLINKVGLDPFQSAVEAANTINGVGDMADWAVILEQSAVEYDAGARLEKIGRKMQMGESAEWAKIRSIVNKGEEDLSSGYIPLSTIESGEVKFIESGWLPFDTHVGGFPEAGLLVEGGNPGVGKTTSMVKFAESFAKKHTNKVVAVSSIEMLLMEVSGRFREITKLPKSVEDRILIDDTPVTAEQAINNASRIDDLGLLIIDFADLMIRGETNESSMAHIYRTLMIGAKQLHIPIILLSQLSYKYKGGLPHPDHLRYTSLAKALAWMVIMLYNPSNDFYPENTETDDALPVIEDRAYMIVWKVRGGFRKHKNDCPGAVQIPFRGDRGWSDKEGRWFSLKKYS